MKEELWRLNKLLLKYTNLKANDTDRDKIDRMINWVKQEERIVEKGVVNYKMPKFLK